MNKSIAVMCAFLCAALAMASDHGQPPAPPSALLPVTGMAITGDTYLVTADNENNAGTGTPDNDMGVAGIGQCLYNTDSRHPIEFNIFVTGPLPTTSALLLLEIWDVDFPQERNEVFFNNVSVGVTTGANNQWSTPSFTIPLGLVVAGKNTVRVQVDTLSIGNWCTWIARGQLIVDGGAVATASCRTISTNKSNYQWGEPVTVTVEADTTLPTQDVRIEVNLKNSQGVIVTGANRTVTITGTNNDPESFILTLPNAGNVETYRAEALIFDSATSVFQTTCNVPFQVGREPIPTLGFVGLAALALLLAVAAAFVLRR